MTTNNQIKNLLGVLFMVGLLVGCAGVQTFPMAARPGDTVTFALGSADGMTKSNITVEYFSDSAPTTPINLTGYISGLFKLYPDKSSNAWTKEAVSIPARSSHGPWMTVLAVNLPDQASGILPAGPGHVHITTAPGAVSYPNLTPNINDVDIALEIIPGAGSPNPLQYADIFGSTITGNLSSLEPKTQVVIKPPVSLEGAQYDTAYGAIEMVVHAEVRTFAGAVAGNGRIRVISDDQPDKEKFQLQSIWSRTGDDFTIMLVSPVGLYAHQARVSIVAINDSSGDYIQGTPSLTSIAYYDINGVPTSGPIPSVVVE